MTAKGLDIQEYWSNIRLLAMDIDGVLTDRGVYVFEDGREVRRFDIQDGLGLKRVLAEGIQVVWISSGTCEAALFRAQRLGIEEVHVGVEDKLLILDKIRQKDGISWEHIAYIGDDMTDLEVMQTVGLACAPVDAVAAVKQVAGYVTSARGGRGAVREICDLLLA